jgi:hypothetical protein
MRRYFCTYFDSNYLPRGMCLYRSLERHGGDFRLFALCMDDEAYRRLSGTGPPRMTPISLADLERGDPELAQSKNSRSRVEYYFTCSPALPLYVLRQCPEIDLITYVDADLYFFADPRPVFDEMTGHSIGIIEHRFTPSLRKHVRNGIYNVGWVSFRRDENGLACLRWWRDRCIEWCYERNEHGKFSDQAYLDDWPRRFRGVRVIQHKGANVAPWNVGNYSVSSRDNRLWIDDEPLLFYHFHHLSQVCSWLYNACLARTGARLRQPLRREVYGVYIKELIRCAGEMPPLRAARNPESRFGILKRSVRAMGWTAMNFLSGSYIPLVRGEPW